MIESMTDLPELGRRADGEATARKIHADDV
jgi:hypothetical protein